MNQENNPISNDHKPKLQTKPMVKGNSAKLSTNPFKIDPFNAV